MRYRAVGAIDEPELTTDPNRLYWMLDGLGETTGERVLVESLDAPGRLLRIVVVGDHLFDLEWRDGAAAEIRTLPRADILVTHQILLRCLSSAEGWESVLHRVTDEFGSPRPAADAVVDYEPTGLSISNAMGDMLDRKRRSGAPIDVPPRLRWGKLAVSTGDVLEAPRGVVEISVEVRGWRPELRHGISLSTPRPALSLGDGRAEPEIILWPTAADSRFDVRGDQITGGLRVTTVYALGGGDRSRVDRWTGEAGFWVEQVSARHRVYHANHYATSPPTFDDLTFAVRIHRT